MRQGPVPRRWFTVLRLTIGWSLIAIAVLVPFGRVRTMDKPKVDCGANAIVMSFDASAASVPLEQRAACQEAAREELIGPALLAGVPGLLLVFKRRLRSWGVAQDQQLRAEGV